MLKNKTQLIVYKCADELGCRHATPCTSWRRHRAGNHRGHSGRARRRSIVGSISISISNRATSVSPRSRSSGTTLPACRARAGARGRRRDLGSGVALRLSAPRRRAASTRRPNCAPASSSTPTSGPAAPAPDFTVLRRPMDLVLVRENTEGFYSDRNMFAGAGEFMPDEDSAYSIRKVTATAISSVARTAFDLARERRRRVTAVHKANVLKLSDGLFLREVRRVAEAYPDVELDGAHRRRRRGSSHPPTGQLRRDRHHQHVRRHLVRRGLRAQRKPRPGRISQRRRRHRGRSGPARVGARHRRSERGQSHILDHLGRRCCCGGSVNDTTMPGSGQAARRIEDAVEAVLARPESRTRDLGGTRSTQEFRGERGRAAPGLIDPLSQPARLRS